MVLPLVGIAAGVAARAAAKKIASNAVKSAATKKLVKEAAKKKPLTTPKSNVKVKPAAKQKPNQPSAAKLMMKEMRSESGQSRKASIQTKKLPKNSNAATQPSNWGSGAKTVKINSVSKQTADTARAAALRAAKNKALAFSAKGKTQTPTAEAARRRNLNK